MTLAFLVLAPSVEAAPATTKTLVASKLALPVTATASWTITDTVVGKQKWDIFKRTTPDLTVMLNATYGPTSCLLTINTRNLAMMKASRLVDAPSYLPAEWYPRVIELSSATGTTVMACADLPGGSVTTIIIYKGMGWSNDVKLATPLLRIFGLAAAWGPFGARPVVDRVVKLPVTELSLELPPSWREDTAPGIDIVARVEPGKPLLRIGVKTDVIQPPMKLVNGKLVQPRPTKKGPADDCQFWADGLRINRDTNVDLITRPAFVPTSWHTSAALIRDPAGDNLSVCLDTKIGRWIAILQYSGTWTEPDLIDATTILRLIAASP
jgi:hypothetical protein